jgi:hypothetical protein
MAGGDGKGGNRGRAPTFSTKPVLTSGGAYFFTTKNHSNLSAVMRFD